VDRVNDETVSEDRVGTDTAGEDTAGPAMAGPLGTDMAGPGPVQAVTLGVATEKVDKTTKVFTGIGVALVTIFKPDGAVDPAATAVLAADLVQRGMRAVLVAGTTGEAGTLTPDERTALIGAIRAAIPADVPIIAGTGATKSGLAIGLTAAAVGAGADAILTYPPPAPPGSAPDQADPAAYSAGLTQFFGAIRAASAGRPVLAYHVPWISAPGVPVADLPGLPVAGIKDSSGSADRLLDELAHYHGATYVGSSALLALAGPMGGAGAILALANVEPERCCQAFGGDAAAQLNLADVHLEVRAGGPAALKRLLGSRGGYCDYSRVS
jgi:4-hydroxy-tetrahydrodipicolinate synthase